MENLSNNKIKEYRELFELFDTDKDGTLDVDELQEVQKYLLDENHGNEFFLRKGGASLAYNNSNTITNKSEFFSPLQEKTNVNLSILDNDLDGNNRIDFEEFVILMYSKYKKASTVRKELKDAFKTFEMENEKFVSKKGIISLISHLDKSFTEDNLNDFFNEFQQKFGRNKKEEDRINYVEFIEYVLNK